MRFYFSILPLVMGLALLVAPPAAGANTMKPDTPHPQRPPAIAKPETKCTPGNSKRERVCVRAWRDREAVRRARQDRKRNPGKFRVAEPEEPAECGFGSPYTFDPDPTRFMSCSEWWWEVTTEERHDDGTVDITGFLNLNTRQWNVYHDVDLRWTHGMTIEVHGGDGTLAGGSPARVRSLCFLQGWCEVREAEPPPDRLVNLTPHTRHLYESVERAVGVVEGKENVADDNFVKLNALGIRFNSDGSNEVPAWTFDHDDLWGRCDNTFTTKRAGCVNNWFTPTVPFERVKYGAAADMIDWAQRHLDGAWGLKDSGRPMHRLTGDLVGDNREILCGDESGFMQDPDLNNDLLPYPRGPNDPRPQVDSCDEFPFAASYESGAMEEDHKSNPKPYVTTGAHCAQVIAYKTADTTVLATDFAKVRTIGEPHGGEPCVRGHIPLGLNTNAGSAYRAEQVVSRIILKDAFWVKVI